MKKIVEALQDRTANPAKIGLNWLCQSKLVSTLSSNFASLFLAVQVVWSRKHTQEIVHLGTFLTYKKLSFLNKIRFCFLGNSLLLQFTEKNLGSIVNPAQQSANRDQPPLKKKKIDQSTVKLTTCFHEFSKSNLTNFF